MPSRYVPAFITSATALADGLDTIVEGFPPGFVPPPSPEPFPLPAFQDTIMYTPFSTADLSPFVTVREISLSYSPLSIKIKS